ncbi:hypothetical protein ABE073_07685 [Lederbergia citrisecunda]|uniref:hypothetical protein n=1 Tax=Lederbergia citrisecunda TaxID=2833583 RepID=UPI003D2C1B85
MWIIIFLLLIISLLFAVLHSLSTIIQQLKMISEHFDVKEKEIEAVTISDEEIEKELEDEDEFMKK